MVRTVVSWGPAGVGRCLALLLCVPASGCSDTAPAQAPSLAAADAVADDLQGAWPPWTLRGRWSGDEEAAAGADWMPALRVGLDASGGPLQEDALRPALERACATWTATGLARFELAGAEEVPDVVVDWGLPDASGRSPFGVRPGVAFTRFDEEGIRVRLDPERDWGLPGSERGEGAPGPFLVPTLAHELGHVLGLGHTERKDALLSPASNLAFTGPQGPDLAGLLSLYGPVEPGREGDLEILRAGSSEPAAAPIRGLATRGVTGFGLLDADADGDDELYVWRTDHAGHGALLILDFGPGPVLSATSGPFVGLWLPGAGGGPVAAQDGSPLFLVVREGDRWDATRLSTTEGRLGYEKRVLALRDLPGDADGDGLLDLDDPAARELFERGLQRRTGDLDGDGRPEEVRIAR